MYLHKQAGNAINFPADCRGQACRCVVCTSLETQRRKENSKIKKYDYIYKRADFAVCFQPWLYKYKNSCGPKSISRVVKQEGLLVAYLHFLAGTGLLLL